MTSSLWTPAPVQDIRTARLARDLRHERTLAQRWARFRRYVSRHAIRARLYLLEQREHGIHRERARLLQAMKGAAGHGRGER